MATKSKTSTGWTFGFKLHIIINDKGEIHDFLITQAHVDDRKQFKNKRFCDFEELLLSSYIKLYLKFI